MRAAVAVVAAATLLTGCTQVIAGHAQGDPAVLKRIAQRQEPLTSQEALGNLRTVNYCSMLAGIKSTARGSFSPPADASFEYCGYFFARGGTTLSYVTVGYLGTQQTSTYDKGNPVADRDPYHQLKVLRLQRENSCAYALVFPDGKRLEIAATSNGLSDAQHCILAEKALDSTIKAVTSGGVEHYTFPDRSLGRLHLCGASDPVLTGEQVRSAAGVNVRLWKWPSGHACTWVTGPNDGMVATLRLATYLSDVLADLDKADGVGGRPTYVEPLQAGCRAVTPQLASDYMLPQGSTGGQLEVAIIEVPDTISYEPCATALALAEQAWPALPEQP